jgi:hypothetical protein
MGVLNEKEIAVFAGRADDAAVKNTVRLDARRIHTQFRSDFRYQENDKK